MNNLCVVFLATVVTILTPASWRMAYEGRLGDEVEYLSPTKAIIKTENISTPVESHRECVFRTCNASEIIWKPSIFCKIIKIYCSQFLRLLERLPSSIKLTPISEFGRNFLTEGKAYLLLRLTFCVILSTVQFLKWTRKMLNSRRRSKHRGTPNSVVTAIAKLEEEVEILDQTLREIEYYTEGSELGDYCISHNSDPEGCNEEQQHEITDSLQTSVECENEIIDEPGPNSSPNRVLPLADVAEGAADEMNNLEEMENHSEEMNLLDENQFDKAIFPQMLSQDKTSLFTSEVGFAHNAEEANSDSPKARDIAKHSSRLSISKTSLVTRRKTVGTKARKLYLYS